jgi:hypothetical protein
MINPAEILALAHYAHHHSPQSLVMINRAETRALAHYAHHYRPKGLEIPQAETLALAHYAHHYRPKGLEIPQAEILALEADYANQKINITFSVDSSRGFYILWIGSS